MSKFQWYVFNSEEPDNVRGSNDVEEVEKFINDPRYTILSAQHGIYFNGDRDEKQVIGIEDTIDDISDDEDDIEGDEDASSHF